MSVSGGTENGTGGFPGLLKTWRRRRRLSQLDLALDAGVSQRHLSFLELGRANPSRSMILQLSETLDVPLRERNAWLTAAGFAPVFPARPLDDPQMDQVMAAVRLMRLFFHPDGARPLIANWPAVAPLLWRRAQREAQMLGNQAMRAVLDELAPFQDETLWAATDSALVPVLPFEIATGGLRLSLFAVIATFDTAQDVTADELRIEMLFPADAATEALFRAALG